MQSSFELTIDGQALNIDDLNTIADEAALADDYVYAELFRRCPYLAGGTNPVDKSILPYRVEKLTETDMNTSSLVTGYGATGSVYVWPFRAIIGTRVSYNPENWYDVRTGMYVGSVLDLATGHATVANPRWDLIYARVDIDLASSPEYRLVKAADGTISQQALSLYKRTTVSLGVVNGSEGASPVRPDLPADGAGAYYIPLVFVLIEHPFTTATVVPIDHIAEIAPVAQMSSATSAVTLQPANGHYSLDPTYVGLYDQLLTRDWTVAAGRPQEFLPSSMAGGASRFFALDFITSPPSIAADHTAVLDDSIDWRNRLMWFTVYATREASNDFAWHTVAGSPTTALEPQGLVETGAGANGTAVFVGNSFNAHLGVVCLRLSADDWDLFNVDSILNILVDGTTGYLLAENNFVATALNMKFVIKVDASGQFPNFRVI